MGTSLIVPKTWINLLSIKTRNLEHSLQMSFIQFFIHANELKIHGPKNGCNSKPGHLNLNEMAEQQFCWILIDGRCNWKWKVSFFCSNGALFFYSFRVAWNYLFFCSVSLGLFLKDVLAGGEPGIFWFSFIFSLNCSAFDHSATAPPPPISLELCTQLD